MRSALVLLSAPAAAAFAPAAGFAPASTFAKPQALLCLRPALQVKSAPLLRPPGVLDAVRPHGQDEGKLLPLPPSSFGPAPKAATGLQKSTKLAMASSESGGVKKVGTLLLGFYFFAWYVLNVGYNIYCKRVLNICPLPWTFAVLQLGMGILYLAPQWLSGIRGVPKPSKENLSALTKVAAFHGLGQLATVTSMSLGSVSFVNVVKALEPVFTAAITLLVLGKNMPWQVWLSMLPVCGGVAMASAGELSFSWGCFICAMISNAVYATRGVLSKASMESSDPGENMTAENTFAVVTLISFVFCIPLALILEGSKISAGLAAVAATGVSNLVFAQNVIITGLLYYTYNEMAFLVLGSVAPVTQSVGNTVKRVVVIVAAAIAFQTPMTPIGIAGSAIAIAGVLLYSIVKGMYPDTPPKPAVEASDKDK